eukprot:275416-Prymnesium_polylepis.1
MLSAGTKMSLRGPRDGSARAAPLPGPLAALLSHAPGTPSPGWLVPSGITEPGLSRSASTEYCPSETMSAA